MDRLRTAVLGFDGDGEFLVETVLGIDYFQLEAIADKDRELATRAAEKYDCSVYDDYRQLLLEKKLDCMLIATSLYSCEEYIKTAMKKKINILKLAPPARDFEEAVELVRLAENEKIKFAIANPCRFSRRFLEFQHFLEEGMIEQPFLVNAVYSGSNERMPSWQSDKELAGGGVLLRNCYEIIDQIVSTFGVPQEVYCLTGNSTGDRKQRHYMTEDTAILVMKFNDIFFGNLTASRSTQIVLEQEFIKVHGKNRIITVSGSDFTVSNSFGQIEKHLEYDNNKSCDMAEVLSNFALSILYAEQNTLISSAYENLKNMAVIESAYLSARTAMPEEPKKIFQMAEAEPTNIWSSHK